MKKILFLVLLLFSFTALAQIPHPTMLSLRGYGGNTGAQVLTNVTSTIDGGFVLGLSTNSDTGIGNLDTFCNWTGGRNIFLKYNSDASVLEWSYCTRQGEFIYPQNDGSFIIGGETSSVPSGWAFKIVKVDTATDTLIWQKTYGGVAASAILRNMMPTEDGGYIMLGETNYTDTDFTIHYGSWMNSDYGIIKVDSNGNKIWSKVIGGTGYQWARVLVPAPGKSCYIVGTTTSNDYDCTGNHGYSSGTNDVYLARLDSNGNIIWHRDLGGTGDDIGAGGWADGLGGILLGATSGSTDGDVTHHSIGGGNNFWVLDIDSSGTILWQNCYGGGRGESLSSICKATDGSI